MLLLVAIQLNLDLPIQREQEKHYFMVNLFGGLIVYTYHPIKPSLDFENKSLPALPPAIFHVYKTPVEYNQS